MGHPLGGRPRRWGTTRCKIRPRLKCSRATDGRPGSSVRLAKPMIVLHHLNNSRSQRILWLLEELGLEYEVKRYERDRKTMLAPPELRAVHPLGKSPIVTDGDATIAQSRAIIES